ncbi:uncharacterized protein LOC110182290 [Drosophila serrata]|uniref:uncharacterized protein LOC110182290 n=1 Tax=Drosophila serrata TaxID=7274 RepID=UPI000A1D08CB|nr:uncharacterized protein LOC110182290 [Drosophila serrata]
METVYIFSIFVSIFFHCMGLFYCPLEASADSFVFIVMAPMFLNKLKVKNGLKSSRNRLDKITECVILCLLMQVLLITIWFPIHHVIQILVDSICNQHRNVFRFKLVDQIQAYAACVAVLP